MQGPDPPENRVLALENFQQAYLYVTVIHLAQNSGLLFSSGHWSATTADAELLFSKLFRRTQNYKCNLLQS